VRLLEPPFGAAIFNFHLVCDQMVGNCHVSTLKLPETDLCLEIVHQSLAEDDLYALFSLK
jgi:hypothetical protein